MNWLWRLKVPLKLQHFLWLCFHNALPINARRHHCNKVVSPSCNCWSSPIEDILHCLRDCPHSREFWLRLNMRRCNNFSLNLMSRSAFMRWQRVLPLSCLLQEYGMLGVGETILFLRIIIGVSKMWCERPFCYMMNAFLTIPI